MVSTDSGRINKTIYCLYYVVNNDDNSDVLPSIFLKLARPHLFIVVAFCIIFNWNPKTLSEIWLHYRLYVVICNTQGQQLQRFLAIWLTLAWQHLLIETNFCTKLIWNHQTVGNIWLHKEDTILNYGKYNKSVSPCTILIQLAGLHFILRYAHQVNLCACIHVSGCMYVCMWKCTCIKTHPYI